MGRIERLLCVSLFLATLLTVSSCGGPEASAYGVVDLKDSPVLPESLAVYIPVPVTARPQVASYTLPVDLSRVAGLDRRSLPPEVLSGLAENGFAVKEGGRYEYMFQLYREKPGCPFVTVDAVCQAFLGMCAGIRMELERGELRREMEALVSSFVEAAKGIYGRARGPVREAARTVLGFAGVAAGLLGLEAGLPPEVASAVEEELALVEGASESRASPVLGLREDYRVFQPHGYYRREPELAEFYRAVTWLGRWVVFPAGMDGWGSPADRLEAARRTAVLVGALHMGTAEEEPSLLLWDHLYQVTRFLSCSTVGLDVAAVSRAMEEVLGERFPLSRLEDDTLLERLAETLERDAEKGVGLERGPWDATGPGFRLLETFTEPGAAVFGELAPGDVPGREKPRGLDLPASLGSDRALQLLDDFYGEAGLPGYREKVRELRSRSSSIEPARARANLVWSVFRNCLSLLRPPGEGYPAFMRSDAWRDRDLYLFLASWVDGVSRDREWKEVVGGLASDGGTGAGGGNAPGKGYVEPRPEVYALLAADADMLRRGLAERGLLSEDSARKLDSFYRLAMGLKSMAEKELTNQPLSAEEYSALEDFGDSLLELLAVPAGEGGGYIVPDPSAIVEVYRDEEEGTALRLAVGRPTIYYVIAPVEGRPTLTVGAGYSFYELWGAGEAVPTPEEWRLTVGSGQVPEASAWTHSFLK